MTEAVALDRVSLRVPANSDVFIPISSHDVLLVSGQQKRRQEGRVAENELTARGVFMGGQNVASVLTRRLRARVQRITRARQITTGRCGTLNILTGICHQICPRRVCRCYY